MSSRFFRSPNSSGSDSSDSSDSEDETELHTDNVDQLDISAGSSLESIAADRVSHGVTNSARDWLLSALLEERCYNQVRSEHQGQRTDDGQIKREAQRRFQILFSRLLPLDLVSPGLDDDRHAAIRQGIRDRLDSVDLSRASSSALQPLREDRSQASLPAPLRRLITDGGVPTATFNEWNGFPDLASNPTALLAVTRDPSSRTSARYSLDFEELSLLGKGGYGEVYSVRHRLDGRIYAVKKVPIRPHMIARIATEGERAMDEILNEVRSLSRLDHPNVVRYFSSWIEWSNKSGFRNSSSDLTSQSIDHSPQALPEAEHTWSLADSLHRIKTASESADDGLAVSFESASHHSESMVLDPSFASLCNSADRSLSVSGPHLALHMQMDVFPMTLADFLSPKPTDTGIAPLCHCFHLEISIRLLQAILEGVEYLHAENVVHRDLKPANIFLKHETKPRPPRSCVNLSGCVACGSNANPAQLSVCIGDFGLVTNLADSNLNSTVSAVGTEIYRPAAMTTQSNTSPTLDIFAAGIIFCELIHKFDTQMERRSFLQELRNGRFPKQFASCAGDLSSQVASIIGDMLRPDHTTVGELQQRLDTILLQVSGLANDAMTQDDSDHVTLGNTVSQTSRVNGTLSKESSQDTHHIEVS